MSRPAVAAAGGELERLEHVAVAGQRPRPDAGELRSDVVRGEALAIGSRFATAELLGCQRLDMCARLRCGRNLRGNRNREERDEEKQRQTSVEFS